MQFAFLLDNVAIQVRHWYEVGPSDEEHGTRVELRTIARPAHIGSESAAQPVTLDEPLWRADIFDLIGEPPGNLSRAHFHPTFEGREPSSRQWDPKLRDDYAGWLSAQLTDVPALLAAAGAHEHVADGLELTAGQLDQVLAAATSLLGVNCDAGQQCLAATRDTTAAVNMMLRMFRAPGAGDPRLATLFHQRPHDFAAAAIARIPAPLGADRLHDQKAAAALFCAPDAAGMERAGNGWCLAPRSAAEIGQRTARGQPAGFARSTARPSWRWS